VPPAVYELSNHDWIDLEVIREITNAIKIVQEELEGEKYITGSRVIPLLEGVRARLDSTRTHFETCEAPSGKFVDLMLLMYVVILVFMLMCVVCVSFTGVITLAGVSIMVEVIAALELRFRVAVWRWYAFVPNARGPREATLRVHVSASGCRVFGCA
jgi:hypothetical protein